MGNCSCLKIKKDTSLMIFAVSETNEGETKYNISVDSSNAIEKRGVSNPSQSAKKKTTSNNNVLLLDDSDVEHNKLAVVKKNSSFVINERRDSKVFHRTFINVVLIGESATGKSSFVIKYVNNKFEPYHVVTLGTEYYSRKTKYNNTEYILNFIVTSGDPNFQEDYTNSYQNVDFFLMFYDVTNKKSFEKLKQTFLEVKKYCFNYKNKTMNAIFIGNKCEVKHREVKIQDAEVFCKKYNIDLFEISVKTNANILKVINKILTTFDDMAKNE